MSRGQNKLIGKLKMAVGDLISIKMQVMVYKYNPTGIKRELVSFGMDCNPKGYVVGIVGGGTVAIHSSGQIIFDFACIEGITLGADEEVDEVAGGASGMGLDR